MGADQSELSNDGFAMDDDLTQDTVESQDSDGASHSDTGLFITLASVITTVVVAHL